VPAPQYAIAAVAIHFFTCLQRRLLRNHASIAALLNEHHGGRIMLHEQKWPQTQEQLAQQVSRLAREVNAMSRTVQRMGAEIGAEAGGTASDLIGEALHHGEVLARDFRKQARHVSKAVRKDPLPAIVAVAGLALVLSLLLGRKE
jgi:ElaB/YqjD/DUF883 family membrane-anchored ribosome-binding protein